jgi:hypothetical protein
MATISNETGTVIMTEIMIVTRTMETRTDEIAKVAAVNRAIKTRTRKKVRQLQRWQQRRRQNRLSV